MHVGGHYLGTCIKSGCVIVGKVIMTVEVAGLRGKQVLMCNNESSMHGLNLSNKKVAFVLLQLYRS